MQISYRLASPGVRLVSTFIICYHFILNKDARGGDWRGPLVMLVDAASTSEVHVASSSSLTSDMANPSSFEEMRKFDIYGPTMTLTLRDPIMPSRGNHLSRTVARSKKALASDDKPMSIDSSFEGFAAKLAARFRISTASSTSTELSQAPPIFENGYMVEDGNIMLGPPSESYHDQSTKQFFPLLGGLTSMVRWSESIKNMQPELGYEIKSRTDSTYDKEIGDMRPFPHHLPFVNAVSCGIKWRPFPTYKPGEGYGHKLLSSPHYVRLGSSIRLPPLARILRPWKSDATVDRSDDNICSKKSLELDVTYRDDSNRKGGRVEVLLGKSLPHLHPQSSERYRSNNHILACFATGRPSGQERDNSEAQSSLESCIEYLRGSIHVPLPSFLHKMCSEGVAVSPSYDFVDKKFRTVASGNVGTSGRSSAVLRLDPDDSTLTLVRRLDEQ